MSPALTLTLATVGAILAHALHRRQVRQALREDRSAWRAALAPVLEFTDLVPAVEEHLAFLDHAPTWRTPCLTLPTRSSTPNPCLPACCATCSGGSCG